MTFSVAYTLLVGMATVYGDDSACLAGGGSCMEDTIGCPGVYAPGLCTGHTSRRCCLPPPSTTPKSGGCSSMNLVQRSHWGAHAPKNVTKLDVPVAEFFIHHTGGDSCYDIIQCSGVLLSIQSFQMKTRGWDDIGYNFMVGEDGNVYEGRGWDHEGKHVLDYNRHSIAASFIGDYMTHPPGSAALDAAKNLLACGVHLGKIAPDYRLFGHRDAATTNCPGDSLYKLIQGWPHYSHARP